jgi:hypothetical protein
MKVKSMSEYSLFMVAIVYLFCSGSKFAFWHLEMRLKISWAGIKKFEFWDYELILSFILSVPTKLLTK